MPATTKKAAAPLPSSRNKVVHRRAQALTLRPSRVWKSFEKFRTGGQSELTALGPGEIGQLLTRTGSFRVLREDDFQHLYGLARDIERVQGGLRVIIAAARSAEQHRDEVTLQALVEAVAVCANFPALPARSADEPVEPEGLPLDQDDLDDIVIDPAAVPRPYASRNADE